MNKKEILINGISYRFQAGLTLFDLIEYLGFNTNLIVIDHNGTIAQKEKWNLTTLQTNDKIEVLTIAGGG